MPSIPPLAYKIYFSILGLILFWWPIDMFLHWDKRTAASMEKDKYIAMGAATIILFVFPYYWFQLPLWLTLSVALSVGIVIPGIWIMVNRSKDKRVDVDPREILNIGMQSPRAQEFLACFPNVRKYVYGLTRGDGDRAHLILHHRTPCTEIEDAQMDYVLDIAVDRGLGIYVGGKEQLQCYFFVNTDTNANVGFLPTSNIGRALDYGFNETDYERAVEEAERSEQRWDPIGEEPLLIQHYPGRVVPME